MKTRTSVGEDPSPGSVSSSLLGAADLHPPRARRMTLSHDHTRDRTGLKQQFLRNGWHSWRRTESRPEITVFPSLPGTGIDVMRSLQAEPVPVRRSLGEQCSARNTEDPLKQLQNH